jgi:hypothetical protein
VGAVRVHGFVSLDGVIDAPMWTFDYGFDPQMGEAILVTGSTRRRSTLVTPVEAGSYGSARRPRA